MRLYSSKFIYLLNVSQIQKGKTGKKSDYRTTKQEISHRVALVTWQQENAHGGGRSEHEEIKMIITSEADIMSDVLTG